MDCLAASELLNARVDGQLSAAEAPGLDAHLAECAECRAAFDALQLQHAQLWRAMAPRRLAAAALCERVLDAVRNETPAADRRWIGSLAGPRRPAVSKRVASVTRMLAAAAAGFVVAVLVFQPWRSEPAPHIHPPVQLTALPQVAGLSVASGRVEMLPHSADAWLACPSAAEIRSGTRVRTGPQARCELSLGDRADICLNTETEVCFDREQRVEVARGQLWSNVANSEQPLEVKALGATVTARDASFELSCQPGRASLSVIQGSAQISGPDGERTVSAGECAHISAAGVTAEPLQTDAVLSSGWVTDLFSLKGGDDPQFRGRVNELLARVGQAKLSLLYEDEIRRLGDAAVLPLVSFLQSEAAPNQPAERLAAARIVADVAQPRSIPYLIELLCDADPAVRAHMAAGLIRLTGRDQGRPPDQWQAAISACHPTQRIWRQWWEDNKQRYPDAPGKLAPTLPAKKG